MPARKRAWRNLLHDEQAVEPLWTTKVIVFPDRWIHAGGVGTRVPVAFVLLEAFDTWAHHTQYVCGNDCRLAKHPRVHPDRDPDEQRRAGGHEGLAFPVIVIDVDHTAKGRMATVPAGAFRALLKASITAEHIPNVVVETNGGAHLYYLLASPITNAALFEAVHSEMRERTKIWASPTGYAVDDNAADWTRITACATVVKADSTDTHGRHVCALHMGPLEWKGFGTKAQKPRSPTYSGPGVRKYQGSDTRVRHFLTHDPPEGERYTSLRDVAFYAHHRYHPSQWEVLRDLLHDRALAIGLDPHETENALRVLDGE